MLNEPDAIEKTKLSVIVPMCNEEDSIDLLKGKLRSLQARICANYDVEYCLIDDGSTDNTRTLMTSAIPSGASCVCAHHERNRGLGAAIRTGFEVAKGAIVCSIDADCSYSPEDLHTLIDLVAGGQADIAIASPYHPQGSVVGVPHWRLLLSQQCSRFYRWVSPLKLHTYTSIFRAYSGEAARSVRFQSNGFVSAVEVLLHAQRMGYRICEAPMVLYARQRGYSKMRIASTISAHLAVMRQEAFLNLTRTFSPVESTGPGQGAPSDPLSTPFSILGRSKSTQ